MGNLWFGFSTLSPEVLPVKSTSERAGLPSLVLLALILLSGTLLRAAEHRGTVTAAGLPLPGAVVHAKQGEHKLTTTTDESGAFRFADLADGTWTIEVESLGFNPLTREIAM